MGTHKINAAFSAASSAASDSDRVLGSMPDYQVPVLSMMRVIPTPQRVLVRDLIFSQIADYVAIVACREVS